MLLTKARVSVSQWHTRPFSMTTLMCLAFVEKNTAHDEGSTKVAFIEAVRHPAEVSA
jgi:hypothetical protein